MRLLRLDFAHGRSSIDLHPFITVATDLSAADRDELVDAVRRLAQGSTGGIRGLVQHQGILVDLDGYGDDRMVAITGANVIIECEPGGNSGTADLRAQIGQTERRLEIDGVVVEELRADLDPAARARVALLEEQLGPDDASKLADLDAEIDRIAGALAAVAAHPRVIHEATDEIIELRRRWAEHSARRAGADDHFSTLMECVKFAEQRAAAARSAAVQAREDAKPVLLTRSQEARLEALSFPDQDGSRKGKWRKGLRPEEEEEKAELLARVGVDSWTAYTVYRAAPTSSPVKVELAVEAEQALAEAESMLEQARTQLATDELTSELNDAEDEIRADAKAYLGQLLPADVGSALDELVVERPNPAWLDAVAALNDQMPSIDPPSVASATSPLEPDLGTSEADGVVVAAERWLDSKRREQTDIDFDRLRAELNEARRTLDRHDRALPRLERAEVAVAASRKRLGELRALLAGDGGRSDAEAALAAVTSVVARVEHEAGGSVPIAVLGQFDSLDGAEASELMEELCRLTDNVQILVISDTPSVRAWVTAAGLERALVSRPKAVCR